MGEKYNWRTHADIDEVKHGREKRKRHEKDKQVLGARVKGGFFSITLRNVKTRRWEDSQFAALRREMGLTKEEFQRAIHFMRDRKRRGATHSRRAEFLRHWVREVRKRSVYRWEPLTFRI